MSSEAVLQKILDLQSKNIEVFVPSLNRNVNFKPLNIRQQKEIIKSSLDKNIPGISFNTVVNEIIADNSVEKDLPFLVIDRLNIIFNLRKNIFGDKINLSKSNSNKIFGSIDQQLSTVNHQASTSIISKIINVDTLKIELKTPTLVIDNKVNKEAQKNLSHLLEKDNTVKDLVSELFVYELIKFIDSIEVEDQKLSFKDLSIPQQIKTLESLPANVNKEIMNYVENIRDFEKQYQVFKIDKNEYNVTIDASFFSSE